MNIFQRLKNKIRYMILLTIKPEIVGGYKNVDGSSSIHTRISNLTDLSIKGDNLKIEDEVFIGHFNYIDAYHAKVHICRYVQITNYVNIVTHSSHNSIRLYGEEYYKTKKDTTLMNFGDIYIGEYSYIGPHSLIMPGTSIGKGCIISAYSFVKGEIPDYSIVRGIPAKVVGSTKDVDKDILIKYPDLKECYYLKDKI
jgi:acetyltransferase-like isoleucine patch superfamily enzyme